MALDPPHAFGFAPLSRKIWSRFQKNLERNGYVLPHFNRKSLIPKHWHARNGMAGTLPYRRCLKIHRGLNPQKAKKNMNTQTTPKPIKAVTSFTRLPASGLQERFNAVSDGLYA